MAIHCLTANQAATNNEFDTSINNITYHDNQLTSINTDTYLKNKPRTTDETIYAPPASYTDTPTTYPNSFDHQSASSNSPNISISDDEECFIVDHMFTSHYNGDMFAADLNSVLSALNTDSKDENGADEVFAISLEEERLPTVSSDSEPEPLPPADGILSLSTDEALSAGLILVRSEQAETCDHTSYQQLNTTAVTTIDVAEDSGQNMNIENLSTDLKDECVRSVSSLEHGCSTTLQTECSIPANGTIKITKPRILKPQPESKPLAETQKPPAIRGKRKPLYYIKQNSPAAIKNKRDASTCHEKSANQAKVVNRPKSNSEKSTAKVIRGGVQKNTYSAVRTQTCNTLAGSTQSRVRTGSGGSILHRAAGVGKASNFKPTSGSLEPAQNQTIKTTIITSETALKQHNKLTIANLEIPLKQSTSSSSEKSPKTNNEIPNPGKKTPGSKIASLWRNNQSKTNTKTAIRKSQSNATPGYVTALSFRDISEKNNENRIKIRIKNSGEKTSRIQETFDREPPQTPHTTIRETPTYSQETLSIKTRESHGEKTPNSARISPFNYKPTTNSDPVIVQLDVKPVIHVKTTQSESRTTPAAETDHKSQPEAGKPQFKTKTDMLLRRRQEILDRKAALSASSAESVSSKKRVTTV